MCLKKESCVCDNPLHIECIAPLGLSLQDAEVTAPTASPPCRTVAIARGSCAAPSTNGQTCGFAAPERTYETSPAEAAE